MPWHHRERRAPVSVAAAATDQPERAHSARALLGTRADTKSTILLSVTRGSPGHIVSGHVDLRLALEGPTRSKCPAGASLLSIACVQAPARRTAGRQFQHSPGI